ncbi:MAG: DUF1801 domain-containing protein [Solirubrobacteraceae bacterium]|nr:DUF1801 domain-containing protein [Solirubrobacteraceae bacterium]
MPTKPTTIDEYFAAATPEVRAVLDDVRAVLLQAVPDAEEKYRYDMPAIMFGDRYGLHYAGWKQHLGLYPVGELPADLEAEAAPFRAKKDSVNFKYAQGIPLDLIGRIAAALAAKHSATRS